MNKKDWRMASGYGYRRSKRGSGYGCERECGGVKTRTQRGGIESSTGAGGLWVIGGTGVRAFYAGCFTEAIRMRYRVCIPQPLRQQQAQHQHHAQKRSGQMHFALDQGSG